MVPGLASLLRKCRLAVVVDVAGIRRSFRVLLALIPFGPISVNDRLDALSKRRGRAAFLD